MLVIYLHIKFYMVHWSICYYINLDAQYRFHMLVKVLFYIVQKLP
jgi:hypothetical protein